MDDENGKMSHHISLLSALLGLSLLPQANGVTPPPSPTAKTSYTLAPTFGEPVAIPTAAPTGLAAGEIVGITFAALFVAIVVVATWLYVTMPSRRKLPTPTEDDPLLNRPQPRPGDDNRGGAVKQTTKEMDAALGRTPAASTPSIVPARV